MLFVWKFIVEKIEQEKNWSTTPAYCPGPFFINFSVKMALNSSQFIPFVQIIAQMVPNFSVVFSII